MSVENNAESYSPPSPRSSDEETTKDSTSLLIAEVYKWQLHSISVCPQEPSTKASIETTPIEKTSKYRPELDGVRCVAVLMVIIYHVGFKWLPGGYLGADIFFVHTQKRQYAVCLEFQQPVLD